MRHFGVAMAAHPVLGWLRGLFALESHPLYLRLATRGALGLLVPLLLGRALGEPALDVVAFTAFLIAYGDLSEDHGWLRRLAAGGLIGGLAVATGVLLGIAPLPAALGMLAWGMALGLAGAYGDGAAAMALPIAWFYLELGLYAPVHTLGEAVERGALVVLGGAWAIALAWILRRLGPEGPLAAETARCFIALAEYFDHTLAPAAGPGAPTAAAGYGPSQETRVRAAIAEARGLAVDRRRAIGASTRTGQRLVMLIALADRVFDLGCALAEARRAHRGIDRPGIAPGNAPAQVDAGPADSDVAGGGAAERALFSGATREVARLLSRRDAETEARVEADLQRFAESRSRGTGDERSELQSRLAIALALALRAAAGRPVSDGPAIDGDAPSPARPGLLERWLAPLRATLDRRSIVGRHALRYGVVTAVAVAAAVILDAPFTYWIPLTVTVVLKPYAGTTLTRAGQRLTSTVAGVLGGVLVLQIVTAPAALIAVIGAAFFASIAVLPLNYAFAIFFLTIGVVPLEALFVGETSWHIGLLRVGYTVVGGALALAGGYLLWPSFERLSLPALLSSAITSLAAYADRVLAVASGDVGARETVEPAHRRAGLDTTNLQASFQRVIAEPGGDPTMLQAALFAVVTLQRLMVSLNALRELAGPGRASAEWARVRALMAGALRDLPAAAAAGTAPAAKPEVLSEGRAIAAKLGASVLGLEVERIALQLDTLRNSLARCAGVR